MHLAAAVVQQHDPDKRHACIRLSSKAGTRAWAGTGLVWCAAESGPASTSFKPRQARCIFSPV